MEETRNTSKRIAPVLFSESYKRQVIEEYLRTGIPKLHIQRKYGIRFKSAIATWMKVFGYMDVHQNKFNLELENPIELAKKHSSTKPVSVPSLEAEINLLKRQLEDEQLRLEMYRRMIDLAEKEYKISIRKNSNTK